MSENALAKINENRALAAAMFAGDAGAGFENATSDDFAVPFLKLLQKNSDEVDRDKGAYVAGAQPGMFFDSATKALFDGFDFVPCFYRRAMVEWRDREKGGGFVAQHEVGFEADLPRDENHKGRWRTGPDTHLVDTRYFFGLRLDADGGATPAVISISSTQTKKARTWMSQLSGLKTKNEKGETVMLPTFASIWTFGSVPEENDKGSWRGYKIDFRDFVADNGLANEARKWHKTFAAQAANFRPPESAADGESAGGGDKGAEVPF